MKGIVLPALVIATLYFMATTYLMNSRLAMDTLVGTYSLTYKINLFWALILGMWSVMGTFGLAILLATALLTGANLAILIQRITVLSKLGGVHFVAGGSSVLGLASSGCVACGLPILPLFGLAGSVAMLPMRGLELSYLSLILLAVSLVLLIKTKPATECKI